MSRSEAAPILLATTIAIDRPIADVWGVLIDYGGYRAWNPYIVAIDGSAEPGATITVHARHTPDAAVTAAPVLVVSLDPYLMRWEGGAADRSQFKGDHFFALTSEGAGRTRLDHFEHFSGTQAAPLLAAHGATITGNFDRFNAALKHRCEAPR